MSHNIMVLDSAIKTLGNNAFVYKDMHADIAKVTSRQS